MISMTKRLYDTNSHLCHFQAHVLSCRPTDARDPVSGYAVILDQTAFFPGGGGQEADHGSLAGQCVLTCSEKKGIITHFVADPIPEDLDISGEIDWEFRFSNMQQHSGEHVLCAVLHNRFGVDNIGFHMGHAEVTLDVNGVFSPEELQEAEKEANAAVTRNLAFTVSYPDDETLAHLAYRSKIEITDAVRIVTIAGADPDQPLDRCACCAPHVPRSGEIGMIKILSSQHYKGGTRISILCGQRALEAANLYQKQVRLIDQLLSAVPENTFSAVQKLKEAELQKKEQLVQTQRRLIQVMAAQTPAGTEPWILFEDFEDPTSAREYVNLVTARRDGPVALFLPRETGAYQYILAIKSGSVKPLVQQLNAALQGRGGGSDAMAQGTVRASKAEIEAFFNA